MHICAFVCLNQSFTVHAQHPLCHCLPTLCRLQLAAESVGGRAVAMQVTDSQDTDAFWSAPALRLRRHPRVL